MMSIDRRTILRSGAAAVALSAFPANAQTNADAAVQRLLGNITEQLMWTYPESATMAGVDEGSRLPLRSRLGDRSSAGQHAIERRVRQTLGYLNRIDVEALSADRRIDVDVVRTAYELTAEGFDFPYGDVAVLNSNWSYRNAPYVVAQNTGAFVEIPSFLDSSHSINSAEDAEAYLARMEDYADQLNGESERVRADLSRGVVLPDFLLDKSLNQLREGRGAPVDEWGVVTSLATRSASLGGDFARHAALLASDRIAPANVERRRRVEAAARRGILRLGAPRRHDNGHDARRSA
jgi:uncharacterized protein (DUF885 family)